MKKIIFIWLLITAGLVVQSCQKEQFDANNSEYNPETTMEKTSNDTPVVFKPRPRVVINNGIQYVKVQFEAETANYYQNTIYMHVKIGGVWTYDLLPVIWNNPFATYQLPTTLPSGTYDVFFSTGPLGAAQGVSSTVTTITI